MCVDQETIYVVSANRAFTHSHDFSWGRIASDTEAALPTLRICSSNKQVAPKWNIPPTS
jgi:hypothetical protein